jgi:hypothetical protein
MPLKKKDKLPNWGPNQRKELTKHWNLFVESEGEDSWDPRLNTNKKAEKEAIVANAKPNDVLRPYLASQDGGHSSRTTRNSFETTGRSSVSIL